MRAVKNNLPTPSGKSKNQNVLVRRAQLRGDQATLEIELENWEDAWSGDRSSLP